MLSPLASAYAQSPRHAGPIPGPCLYGAGGVPGDGPYVELWLIVKDGVIERAAFRTPGCPTSVAAAGLLCALVERRAVSNVSQLSIEDLDSVLGAVPEGKAHFPCLAIQALKAALSDSDAPKH